MPNSSNSESSITGLSSEQLFNQQFPLKTRKVESLYLNYLHLGAPTNSQQTNKQPIVFLHGQFTDLSMWQAQLSDPALQSQYDLLAWNAPGYGGTEMWPHLNPSALNFALMLRGWLEEEITQPAVLVGHGVGALMACAYAARFPMQVAGIILTSPNIGFNRLGSFRNRQGMQDSNMLNTFGNEPYANERAKVLMYMPEELSEDAINAKQIQENYQWIHSKLMQLSPEALEAMTWTIMNEDIEYYRHYFHKKSEVWIGQHDNVIQEAEARRLAIRYHSRFEVFEETGHLFPIEASQQFNANLLRFMVELAEEQEQEKL